MVAPASIVVPSIEEHADEVAQALGELLGRSVTVKVQGREALRNPEQPTLFEEQGEASGDPTDSHDAETQTTDNGKGRG